MGWPDNAAGWSWFHWNGQTRMASLSWLAVGSLSTEVVFSPFNRLARLLLMVASGFQRAAREPALMHKHFSSLCYVTFAIVPLVKESHTAKPHLWGTVQEHRWKEVGRGCVCDHFYYHSDVWLIYPAPLKEVAIFYLILPKGSGRLRVGVGLTLYLSERECLNYCERNYNGCICNCSINVRSCNSFG